jgi:hypothetical protein
MNRIYRGLRVINAGIQISFAHFIYFHYKRDQLCQPPSSSAKMKSSFHEAGHTVCAHKLGLRVTKVCLCDSATEWNDTCVGETHVEAHTKNYFEDNVKNTIKLYLAGIVVEHLLYDRNISDNWSFEWYNGNLVSTSDWLEGLNTSEILGDSDLDSLRKYINRDKDNRLPILQHQDIIRLPDELKRSWDMIGRVAIALMNLGLLTGNNLLIVLSDNYYQYISNIFVELLRSHSEIRVD